MSRAKSDPMQTSCAEPLPVYENADDRPLHVVAVDLPPRLIDLIRETANTTVETVCFNDVDLHLLARTTPDFFVGRLFESQWDILDLADLLVRLGFGGRLYAMTPPLPDAGKVISEVRRHSPEIQIDLIVLDGTD